MAGVIAACSTAERDFTEGAPLVGGAPAAGGAPDGSPSEDPQGGTGGAEGTGAAPGDDQAGGAETDAGGEAAGAGGEGGEGGEGGASTSKCEPGETRTCGEAGILGTCATGEQACGADGRWSECSKLPAREDTCAEGNDDDCDGIANGGCKCIEGVTTSPCGDCDEGTRLCMDGKQNAYGECVGAIAIRTYYRDADGDGYGSSDKLELCSNTTPAGYVDKGGDCCDVADKPGTNVLPAMIHPGQVTYFSSAADVCGVGWDYDCSGGVQTDPPKRKDQCCVDQSFVESDCGTGFGVCSCNVCTVTGCGSGGVVRCR